MAIHPTLALCAATLGLSAAALIAGQAWLSIPIFVGAAALVAFVDPTKHIRHARFQPGRPLFQTTGPGQTCQDDWYLSIMSRSSGETVDVALMIRKAGTTGREHEGAYILVIDYARALIAYYRYGLDEVVIPAEQGGPRDFRIEVGDNVFASDRVELSLPRARYCGEQLGALDNHQRLEARGGLPERIELQARFTNRGPNHAYNWFQQGIMGLASLIPINSFWPDVLVANATLEGGWSDFDGRRRHFRPEDHRVYMERYHGSGFPSSWMWGGCQQWVDPERDVSFVYGIVYESGKMPGAGWSFGLQVGERFYSFSPGHFGRLDAFTFTEIEGVRRIHGEARDARGNRVVFDCVGASADECLPIHGIDEGRFEPALILDHGCAGSIELRFEPRDGPPWTARSLNPAFEFTGDYASVYAQLREQTQRGM